MVDWKGHDHTCGGRKEVELGRGLLPCSVLESRPELSPQGGMGALVLAVGSRRFPTALTPWSGFCDVFWKSKNHYATCKITFGKIPEMILLVIFSIFCYFEL